MFIIVLVYVLVIVLFSYLYCICFYMCGIFIICMQLFRMWHCCNLIEPLKFQFKEGSVMYAILGHIPHYPFRHCHQVGNRPLYHQTVLACLAWALLLVNLYLRVCQVILARSSRAPFEPHDTIVIHLLDASKVTSIDSSLKYG